MAQGAALCSSPVLAVVEHLLGAALECTCPPENRVSVHFMASCLPQSCSAALLGTENLVWIRVDRRRPGRRILDPCVCALGYRTCLLSRYGRRTSNDIFRRSRQMAQYQRPLRHHHRCKLAPSLLEERFARCSLLSKLLSSSYMVIQTKGSDLRSSATLVSMHDASACS